MISSSVFSLSEDHSSAQAPSGILRPTAALPSGRRARGLERDSSSAASAGTAVYHVE